MEHGSVEVELCKSSSRREGGGSSMGVKGKRPVSRQEG